MTRRIHESPVDSSNDKKKKRLKIKDDKNSALKISNYGTESSNEKEKDSVTGDTGYLDDIASDAADMKIEKRTKRKIKDNLAHSDGQSIDEVVNAGKRKRKRVERGEIQLEMNGSSPDVVENPGNTIMDGVVEASPATLTEKAQKALTYARMQSVEPSNWKFNKNLQGWLVKNFWSNVLIPDEYLEVVIKYLAGCQGGTRTALEQTCHILLSSDKSSKEAVKRNPPEDSEVNRARAHKLLEALGKP